MLFIFTNKYFCQGNLKQYSQFFCLFFHDKLSWISSHTACRPVGKHPRQPQTCCCVLKNNTIIVLSAKEINHSHFHSISKESIVLQLLHLTCSLRETISQFETSIAVDKYIQRPSYNNMLSQTEQSYTRVFTEEHSGWIHCTVSVSYER